MLTRRHLIVSSGALALAAGCGPQIKRYNGPEVTRIQVQKGARAMYMLHHGEVLKAYDIELGFAPVGHKQFEGDGKTPEGRYYIDRRNPNSSYWLSLGISYPNAEDIAYAKSQGKNPGGDIFIHGRTRGRRGPDWTAGCISVRNGQMEDIYSMVRLGTPIDILA